MAVTHAGRSINVTFCTIFLSIVYGSSSGVSRNLEWGAVDRVYCLGRDKSPPQAKNFFVHIRAPYNAKCEF